MGAIVALAAVAALAGGGVAAVGVHALDATDNTVTTTVEAAASSNGSTTGNSSPGSDANAAFARSGGKSVSSIYKQDAPGVVTITSTIQSSTSGDFNPFGPGQSQQETAQGSGFVIDKQGRILTNAHVVEGATSVVVAFEDGVTAKASVLGRDSLYDLAVIKVDVPDSELHPLKLGTVNTVQVGDPVVAIGNPFGYAQTVTAGIVSAKNRLISSPSGSNKFIPGAIQTDAAINHGNSGGPLIDRHGEVIAINAQIADPQISGTNANAGVGFAIPIDLAKRALSNLESGKPASHPYLGIRVDALNASVAAANSKVPAAGLLIAGVAKGSPAAAAGLKGGSQSLDVNGQSYCVGGDVITAIQGHAVNTLDDLQQRISGYAAGDKINLSVTGGDGSKRTVSLTVGSMPAQRQPLQSGC
ncbi:MAG TPA: trypsin-like peptidase domain-containing protein [Gaiellales bacterium]|jgi:S1-C subfamily serine protease|nr:trypsin-like peptidase domain-containing protein [Gaiellales bacterium]